MPKQNHLTEATAREQYSKAMAYLDSILDEPEDFGSATFAEDVLVVSTQSGHWIVDWGTIIYSLQEQGLSEDANALNTWLNQASY